MIIIKNKFINVELDWAEEQLATWKEYVSKHPFGAMEDRVKWKETKSGGMLPIVIASIESQQKNIRDTMKDYLSLLEIVDRLRLAEAKKAVETRGGIEIPDIMKG